MQNLEQKRAAHALKSAPFIETGKEGGEIVKKIPPLIMDNGILASMAFACETKGNRDLKNKGHHSVFMACIDHLKKNTDLKIPVEVCTDVRSFLKWMSSAISSGQLRAITTETLAYLAYLRRFVQKKEKNHD